MLRNWIIKNIFEQKLGGRYRSEIGMIKPVRLLICGIILLMMATTMLFTSIGVFEKTIKYSEDVSQTIFLPQGKIYIYVDLYYYQNVLKYSKSINFDQLKGETKNLNLIKLEPYDKKNGLPYYPAGKIAATYLQDKIEIEGLDIEQDEIAADGDKKLIGITDYSSKNIQIPKNWTKNTNKGTKALNFTDEKSNLPILNARFVNWVRISLFAPVKKLWGIVNVENAGDYNLNVKSLSDFDKRLYFAKCTWFGLRNILAVVIIYIIGTFCVLMSFAS